MTSQIRSCKKTDKPGTPSHLLTHLQHWQQLANNIEIRKGTEAKTLYCFKQHTNIQYASKKTIIETQTHPSQRVASPTAEISFGFRWSRVIGAEQHNSLLKHSCSYTHTHSFVTSPCLRPLCSFRRNQLISPLIRRENKQQPVLLCLSLSTACAST